jgi:hypothetical protein
MDCFDFKNPFVLLIWNGRPRPAGRAAAAVQKPARYF